MESIRRFITAQLKLQVNQQKSAVARPWERKFLGFSSIEINHHDACMLW
jgi:RNA-directed DNA polymerase